MKWWPFKSEKRDAPDGDAVIAALLGQQSGDAAVAAAVGAVEAAAGIWARAFASASVEPATAATRGLTPQVLGAIARRLVTLGESLHLIAVSPMAGIQLIECSSWDVRGGDGWTYQIDLPHPARTQTRVVSGEQVIHCRWATKRSTPWRGESPLSLSTTTAGLAKRIEQSLYQDFGSPIGTVIFGGAEADIEQSPGTGEPQTEQLRDKVSKLRGGVAVANADRLSGPSDLLVNNSPTTERIGPSPPAEIAQLRTVTEHTIYASMGIPPALVAAGSAGAQRESWRQFLHGAVRPVARTVEQELAAKLDTPVTLGFDALFASDLTGRARAFRQLIDGGVSTEEAKAVCGL